MTSQFVSDATLSPLLAAGFMAAVDESTNADDPSAAVSDWLIEQGYSETFDQVHQALTEAQQSSVSAWPGYLTLYAGSVPSGRMVITNTGVVSLDGTTLSGAVLADQTLTWPAQPGGAAAGALQCSIGADGRLSLAGDVGGTPVQGVRGRFAPGGNTAPDPLSFWAGDYLVTREVRPAGDTGDSPALEQRVLSVTSSGEFSLDGNALTSTYADGVLTWEGLGRGQLSGRLIFALRPEDGAALVVGHMVLDTEEPACVPNAVGWRIASLLPPPGEVVRKEPVEGSVRPMVAAVAAVAAVAHPGLGTNWSGSYAMTVDGSTSTLVQLNVAAAGDEIQINGVAPLAWDYATTLTATTADGWSYDLQFVKDVSDIKHKLVSGTRSKAGTTTQYLYGDSARSAAEQWSGKDIAALTASIGSAFLAILAIGFSVYSFAKQKKDAAESAKADQKLQGDMNIELHDIGANLSYLRTPGGLTRASTLVKDLQQNQNELRQQIKDNQKQFESYASILDNDADDNRARIVKMEAKLDAAKLKTPSEETQKEIDRYTRRIDKARTDQTELDRIHNEAKKSAADKGKEKETADRVK